MIDWENKPEGAQRYNKDYSYKWLKRESDIVSYYDSDIVHSWIDYGDIHEGLDDWNNATPDPSVQPETPSTVDSTINERGERYGKFNDGADIMQTLKNVMRETDGWERLTPSQREALEMIQHKIGRVLNGDPNYDDNWRDICGYSQLILDELNGTKR
jgi:hypothetical protein